MITILDAEFSYKFIYFSFILLILTLPWMTMDEDTKSDIMDGIAEWLARIYINLTKKGSDNNGNT